MNCGQMKPITQRGDRGSASKLRSWWTGHRTTLLRLAVVLMAVAGLVWLGYQFWRLLCQSPPIWPSSPTGAVDLKLRHEEVHHWFTGKPVYGEGKPAAYPPASYVILWPLLGWLAVTPARWLWAATTVAALGWLVWLIVRESGADTLLERVFVALIPFSMYATGAAIGNGQLIVHFLPMLVTGLLLLRRNQRRWHEDLWVAALVLMAMVKPSVSAPFFWIVLFVPGRLRPALLVALGYVTLTCFAASFQAPGLLPVLRDWTTRALEVSAWESLNRSNINLHSWSAALGLEEWNAPASLLMLTALGLWTYRHRHADLWLLLGVAALVARFWTYHRWYDDLLILLPMIALFRIAKRDLPTDSGGAVARALLAITILTMLAPGGLYLFPPPWNSVYVAAQTIVWIVVLIFLLGRGRSVGQSHR